MDELEVNNHLKKFAHYFFGEINIKNINDDKLLIFPKYNLKILNLIYKNRIDRNIIETLYKLNINGIVLSKSLKEDENFKKMLYQENLNVLNGRYLFELMLVDCIDYIAKMQHKHISDLDITILVNDISTNVFYNIWLVAGNVKNICIVTNYIDKYKKIQEKIKNQLGVILRLSNNKRKSLSNSKIIINMDFSEESINKYIINEKAIIININQKIKIKSKRFCGINICNYKIKVPQKILEMYGNSFDTKEIYESLVYNESNLYEVRNKIKADNIKIKTLVGNKGEICDKEYLDFA